VPELYSKTHLNINTLSHLSHRLGFNLKELQKIASKAETLYKFDREPKKSGQGYREISKPSYKLKSIQKSIHMLLLEIKVSKIAHCGIKGKSNLSNAKNHCNKNWIFSLDFENFFPNISHHRVYGLFFRDLKCAPKVASLLTRLSTVRKQVPQGGPMSMDLANLVCRKLDQHLEILCAKYGISYTRHCDDLNFSGKRIPESFKKNVKDIIKRSGFLLNSDKELCTPHHKAQSVVGLRVNRKTPLVPRNIKRKWRQERYYFEKYEKNELVEGEKIKKKQRLDGQEAYVNYIDRKHKMA
jgi:hypothetical protein